MSFMKKCFGFFLGIIYPLFFVNAEIIPVNDEVVFHPSVKITKFNTYETDDFRFDYAPNFSVKKWNNFIFLEENTTKNVVWTVFEPTQSIRYKIKDFTCFSNLKKQKEFCVKNLKNPHFIKNLILFPQEKVYEQEKIKFFKKNIFFEKYDQTGFFNRGDMIALTLKLKYPNKDFTPYAQRCFLDVFSSHPYSGEICWAKSQGIIMGIDRNFYPEASINVWGILKILGLTFEQPWPEPDWDKIPESFMSKLHKEHIAADMLASAWEYGILKNIENQSLWPNRSIKQKEVMQIVSDFLDWKSGKVIKAWKAKNYTPPISKIFYKQDYTFQWDGKKESKKKHREFQRNVVIENSENISQVWLEDRKGFFISSGILPKFPEKIKTINAWFDFEKWEGEIEIILESGTKKIFRPKIKKSQFSSKQEDNKDIKNTINILEKYKRSPRLISTPKNVRIPIFDIEMSSKNFEHFFANTTRNTRYPATLKISYPDGEVLQYSITLKARGNANRGYIKPSLTIESFQKFSENSMYYGDEFLKKNDEIKLRSFINEESMVHEKLFYRSAKGLNLPAPDFFEALVKINDIPFGFFQITEPIKKEFFKKRDLETTDYFYAQNINAKFDTNLGYYDSDEKTLSAYESKGDKNLLLDLIKSLDKNDPEILNKIDTQSIFDYATLIWLSNAWDSLTHNYYIFWNKDTEKWEILPWDGDLSWEDVPENITLENLDIFAKNKTGNHNVLINYVFENISLSEKQIHWDVFWEKWNKNVKLFEWSEEYRTNHKKYCQYDNKLWNGKFLERKKPVFDTDVAILRLKRELKKISNTTK